MNPVPAQDLSHSLPFTMVSGSCLGNFWASLRSSASARRMSGSDVFGIVRAAMCSASAPVSHHRIRASVPPSMTGRSLRRGVVNTLHPLERFLSWLVSRTSSLLRTCGVRSGIGTCASFAADFALRCRFSFPDALDSESVRQRINCVNAWGTMAPQDSRLPPPAKWSDVAYSLFDCSSRFSAGHHASVAFCFDGWMHGQVED